VKVEKEVLVSVIPKHKMAIPFCVFKTLTEFGFQFIHVTSHFCELAALKIQSSLATLCFGTTCHIQS